jgi:hypothetical protein
MEKIDRWKKTGNEGEREREKAEGGGGEEEQEQEAEKLHSLQRWLLVVDVGTSRRNQRIVHIIMFEEQSQEETITAKNYFYSDWLAWVVGQTRGAEEKAIGSDMHPDKLSRERERAKTKKLKER